MNIPHSRRFQPNTGGQMRIIRFGGARMATRLWPDLCGADDWCSGSHHFGNGLLMFLELLFNAVDSGLRDIEIACNFRSASTHF